MGQGSLSGWSEAILLSIAFVLVLGLVVGGLNAMYGQSNEIPLAVEATEQEYIDYLGTASGEIEGGEADFESDAGLTLKSSWGITKNVFTIIGNFFTGGWIEQLADMMALGEAGQLFARYLRILYILSLIFAVLYILFKVIA